MDSFCQKCGRPLGQGELKYKVRIELTSMFDGFIPEPEGDIDVELERLIEAVSQQDPGEMAKDVAQTIILVMCRDCRNRLVKEYDISNKHELLH